MLIRNPRELEILFNNDRQVVIWVLSRDLARIHGWKRLFRVSPSSQRGRYYIVPYSLDIDLDNEGKRRLVAVVEAKATALFGGSGDWPSPDFSGGATVSEMKPARFRSLFQAIRIKNLAGSNQSRFEILYGAADDFEPLPCDEPTSAPVGTPERIAVYRRRLERGVSLYHSEDKILDDSGSEQ